MKINLPLRDFRSLARCVTCAMRANFYQINQIIGAFGACDAIDM